MKPIEYREPCLITEEIPYQVEEGALKGTHASTGQLDHGRVVWIRDIPKRDDPNQQVSVYAEGIGIIMVEARFLRSSS